MGQTLSEPVVEKISESGEDERFYFGLSTMQGWRISMEDSHTAVLDLQAGDKTEKTSVDDRISFFGVYDGHGGDGVALFSGDNVHKIVAKEAAFAEGDYEKALKDGFLASDRAILQDSKFCDEVSGCTASTAIISGTKVYCANAGDSRTVLGVKGRAKPLSFDHKPQNEGEKARICAAGGFVDFGRVNGNLALSRAIGDFEFKKSADLPPEQQIVTAFPDVVVHEISDDDEFLVIACDGIWDCQSSQQVIEFVRRGIVAKQDLHKICENIMDNCLAPNSDNGGVGCDNMTIMVIAFLRGKTKEEWYDLVAKRVADGDGPCAPPEYAIPKQNYWNRYQDREEGAEGSGNYRPHGDREGGRIIMLGDGTEVLTDSDDAEMFDYGEDEGDAEELDKEDITASKKKGTNTENAIKNEETSTKDEQKINESDKSSTSPSKSKLTDSENSNEKPANQPKEGKVQA